MPLRAGLIGLGRGGQQIADALLRSSWCELVCAASRKPDRLEAFAERCPQAATFNDFRLAIVSRPIDVLFVAVPPFLRLDYMKLAAERRIPVWLLSPPSHRYEDLVEMVELFERVDVPIESARTWGAESTLKAQSIGLDRLGPLFLAEGRVSTCWSGELQWRGDSSKAGGGVLLDRGYLLLDAIVQLLGMPASVLASLGRMPQAGPRTLYATEDTAALVCQYPDGAVASLTACRTSGPDEWTLRVCGRDGSLTVGRSELVMCDRTGQRELLRQPRSVSPLAEQIDEFLSMLQTNPRALTRRLREHLPTMAVIQSAYLSARTSHPENPATIVEMHRLH